MIISAADEPKAFGGSIYFMVLDRGEGHGNDTWGTKIKDFDPTFQAGLDDALKPSPGLDKKARYLYLYQVINDRGSPSPISRSDHSPHHRPRPHHVVGLLRAAPTKDPRRRLGVGTGVGFLSDASVKNVGRADVHRAPRRPGQAALRAETPRARRSPNPYGLGQIKVNNAVKAVADDPEAENTGRTPATVLLLDTRRLQGRAGDPHAGPSGGL